MLADPLDHGHERLTHWRIPALGFPQLHGIAFRIVEAGEESIGIGFGIDRHFNAGRLKLAHHRSKLSHPKVDHPNLSGRAKV